MQEAQRIEELEGALRSLASYVAAGGYNTPSVDPGVFEEKIRCGIGHLLDCERHFSASREAELYAMLTEAAALFRFYEAQHQAKGEGADTQAKAARNADIAGRIEALLQRAVPAVEGAKAPHVAQLLERLRGLCAAAYQVVGAASGPREMLDNLSDAGNGETPRHEPGAGLPWMPSDTAWMEQAAAWHEAQASCDSIRKAEWAWLDADGDPNDCPATQRAEFHRDSARRLRNMLAEPTGSAEPFRRR